MQLRSLNKIEHSVLLAMVQVIASQIDDKNNGMIKTLIEHGINPAQTARDLAKELEHSAVFLLSKGEVTREEQEVTEALNSLKEGFAA